MVASGGEGNDRVGEDAWGLTANEDEVSFWSDESILGLDSMMIVQIFDFLKTIDLHILKERIYGMWTMSQESCYKNKQNKNFSALNHPENVVQPLCLTKLKGPFTTMIKS